MKIEVHSLLQHGMASGAPPSWQDIAERVLDDVIERHAQADRALKRALQDNRHLSGEERGLVADVVLGASCLHGRLRFQLQQASLSADAQHLAALYLLDELGLSVSPDVEKAALRITTFPQDPLERLAAERSLPLWLARRFLEERDYDDADALAIALNRRGPITARANALKVTRVELRRALDKEGIASREGSLSPWSLQLEAAGGKPNIHGSSAWRSGLFEVQDEGSQMIALATQAKPGDVVIDYCAGRGGKSLALAAMMRNEGRVLAHDVDERRLADLVPRRARAGASCIEIVSDASELGVADVVLVDAPCSETGALRRGPHKRWLLDEEEVARLPRLQLEILERAAGLVKPGGRLVYATCSLLKSENDDVAARFLEANPRFAVIEARELTPHQHGSDGFYICAAVAG